MEKKITAFLPQGKVQVFYVDSGDKFITIYTDKGGVFDLPIEEFIDESGKKHDIALSHDMISREEILAGLQ